MIIKTPTTYFLACGHSEGFMPLNAFDSALLNAGIGDVNLVRLSSILPPNCQEIEPIRLPYGALVPTAYAGITRSTPGEIISAGVAIAIPQDPRYPGLIMEYSAPGTEKEIHERVRNMAEEGLRYRDRRIKEIRSAAVQHEVRNHGSAIAAVVLWGD